MTRGSGALIILTMINILNYIDRNIFSALVPAIKADLGFSDLQLGLLGSAFILSYTLISPLFGFWGDRGSRSRVMGAGVAIWSAATAVTGIASSFLSQFSTRVTVGLGEAAYSVIAPSVIADHFPKASRGKVFALYGCAIPVGSALGYVLGGLLEPRVGWQKAFFVVGVPGAILACLLFFMKDPARGTQDADVAKVHAGDAEMTSKNKPRLPIRAVYGLLFRNGSFLCTVLGYAAYTFVVGGMAFWMPTFIVRYFEGVSVERANLVFGGVTVVGGFLGTILGGWWADRVEKKSGNGYLKVSVISMLITVPLFVYMLKLQDFSHFALVLFFMEIALFMCMSPLDAAVINSVRPEFRATAMALDIFLIHALGDGISRILMGAVSDASGLRSAVLLLPWMLLFAALLWQIGVVFFWQSVAWPEGGLILPEFQAHRGLRVTPGVRENTLAAFREAREMGAEMIECDVHLASDGQPVVFHDFDLKRIVGRDDLVSRVTSDDMLTLADAPTLRSLLSDPLSPKLVNIELKTEKMFTDGALESAVVRVIHDVGAEKRILFSSFNPFILRKLAKLAPDVPRAYLMNKELTERRGRSVPIRWMNETWFAFWARPHLLHLNDEAITASSVEMLRERGVRVVAWTVNDPKRARELLDFGVVSVISDHLFTRVHLD